MKNRKWRCFLRLTAVNILATEILFGMREQSIFGEEFQFKNGSCLSLFDPTGSVRVTRPFVHPIAVDAAFVI